MCVTVPAAYFWHTEVPRKVSRQSESGGRSWPAPPPNAIAHPFLWPFSAGRTWRPAFGRLFLGAPLSAAYFWHTEAPRKVSRLSESGGRSWPAPPPKAIAHPFLWAFSAGRTWRPGLRAEEKAHKNGWAIAIRFWGLFPLDELAAPAFGWLFFGVALPAAYFWHTEAPRKVSRHSESGGRSWPAPPPKAIAHPFLWPFSAGRTCRPGLRAVIFGCGCARSLFLAHGGTS